MSNRLWSAAIVATAGALILLLPGQSPAQALRNNYGNWTHFYGNGGFLDGGGFNIGYGGLYPVSNYLVYSQVYNVAPPPLARSARPTRAPRWSPPPPTGPRPASVRTTRSMRTSRTSAPFRSTTPRSTSPRQSSPTVTPWLGSTRRR